ncbi:MAG: HAD family hydrolase [Kouleothrix sp.]|jgi:HAD superfamily hydrolase (TIGR01549 family)|nr:HAD family hydrolase [Kouleothrix sp.]
MAIEVVFFDVGETLVDETRLWAGWAEWLGVPLLTFFGVLGGVIARGEHHRRVFEIVRPGIDLVREQAARQAAGQAVVLEPRDFYPDALACLAALRRRGYRVGLAGNQPAEAEQALRAMNLPVEYVASSAGWGIEKPAPEFFARMAALAGAPPERIAYVGDRADNDVAPAAAAGMLAVFLLRGPWACLQAGSPAAARAHLRISTLAELPEALASFEY